MKITPNGGLCWYIKWTASVLILSGLAVRAMDTESAYRILDLSLNLSGVVGWLFVGLLWHDRALIILNAVASTMLTAGLIATLS